MPGGALGGGTALARRSDRRGGWSRRYGARIDTWRLPTSKTKHAELVAAYGTDAVVLLRAVYDPRSPV